LINVSAPMLGLVQSLFNGPVFSLKLVHAMLRLSLPLLKSSDSFVVAQVLILILTFIEQVSSQAQIDSSIVKDFWTILTTGSSELRQLFNSHYLSVLRNRAYNDTSPIY